MNTHEFIKKHVDIQLQAEGLPLGVCMIAAAEALEFYKQKDTFPKGAFNECLTFARKRAKDMASKPRSTTACR